MGSCLYLNAPMPELPFAEVVLSLLIEAFKLCSSEDKEVVWHITSILTPAIVGSDMFLPQFPLVNQ